MSDDEVLADRLDHIVREALPWHRPEQALTECGRSATSLPTITAAEWEQRRAKLGQRRTSYSVCSTCESTAGRWSFGGHHAGTWASDPVGILARWVDRIRFGRERDRTEAELRAIAALVEAHRDEFDGYLAGLDETVDLTARRTARRRTAGGRP